MIDKQLTTKFILVGAVMGAMLPALMLSGCAGHNGAGEDRDAEHATQSQHSEREGGQSGAEHDGRGEDGEERGEHGTEGEGSDQSRQSREAETSSPITPLDQEWNGVLGGVAVAMRYDAATDSVHTTVRNTLSGTLCYVQVEPHLKAGTRTVGELGPDKMGDLEPGQEASSTLRVDSEPKLAGVSFDGYVAHIEVYDCSGPGPTPHGGEEGAQGSDEHGSGGEGGDQSAGGDEDGRGADALALNETLDTVRSGGRLILRYHAPSNSFRGTVQNTTNSVLTRVRIEVHLSNGVELGPTTPTDMAPGEVLAIDLPATQESFTGWTAHAEVGGGDGGSESGGEHSGDDEQGGEHRSGREQHKGD